MNNELKVKMDKVIEQVRTEFTKLRTGRATTALLDSVRADCYGNQMPLNQLATLSVPEPRTIIIAPWDKGVIGEIEKAIMKSDLGLQPTNDGKVVRINLPPPTEERRKELAKLAKKSAEEGRVGVRNVRREANEAVKKLQKEAKISEDELKRSEDEIQKMTDQEIAKIDSLLAQKEKEILEV